jgi:hypothetical protein
LRRCFDLDAELPLRSIPVKVAWGSPSTGADVWEEFEGADVREGVGKGEDVVADWYWCDIFVLSMMAELVDVEDDLV